jgi:acetyl-CoA synthetase
MRRVIASISNFTDVGDVSTLANPDIVEEIQEQVQSAKKEKEDVPKDLSDKEKEEIATYGEGSE